MSIIIVAVWTAEGQSSPPDYACYAWFSSGAARRLQRHEAQDGHQAALPMAV